MSIFDSAISTLPALPLQAWEPTRDTLHLWVQIVGKIRLSLMPHRNHWWHATLSLNSRGIGTGPMPWKDRFFEISFDFIDHQLEVIDSRGHRRHFLLRNGLSVAAFYRQLNDCLSELGITVRILARPYDNKSDVPFARDNVHHDYDTEYVQRFFRILLMTDGVFKKFSGRFSGKCSPVQFFWHSFDLAVTRFSGRRAPQAEDSGRVNREAYSHEVISAGFWTGDNNTPRPSFYSYTYPSPPGLDEVKLTPAEAHWEELRGSPIALYSYEDFRQHDDPEQALLGFLESSYLAGAQKARWNTEALEASPW